MRLEPFGFHQCLRSCFVAIFAIAMAMRPLAAATPPSDAELQTLLQRVEQKYNRLQSLRMRFEQIYSQGPQVVREERGTLYLRKPGQMRWEYDAPQEKIFLTDGKTLSLYVPAERRVTQTKVTESDDLRNPMRFLLGKLKFEKEFQRVQRAVDIMPLDAGNTVIRAVPKRMEMLESVVMEITPQHDIRRLVLMEPGGNQTEFRFTHESLKGAVSAELFKFKAPEGTEVVRQ